MRTTRTMYLTLVGAAMLLAGTPAAPLGAQVSLQADTAELRAFQREQEAFADDVRQKAETVAARMDSLLRPVEGWGEAIRDSVIVLATMDPSDSSEFLVRASRQLQTVTEAWDRIKEAHEVFQTEIEPIRSEIRAHVEQMQREERSVRAERDQATAQLDRANTLARRLADRFVQPSGDVMPLNRGQQRQVTQVEVEKRNLEAITEINARRIQNSATLREEWQSVDAALGESAKDLEALSRIADGSISVQILNAKGIMEAIVGQDQMAAAGELRGVIQTLGGIADIIGSMAVGSAVPELAGSGHGDGRNTGPFAGAEDFLRRTAAAPDAAVSQTPDSLDADSTRVGGDGRE